MLMLRVRITAGWNYDDSSVASGVKTGNDRRHLTSTGAGTPFSAMLGVVFKWCLRDYLLGEGH